MDGTLLDLCSVLRNSHGFKQIILALTNKNVFFTADGAQKLATVAGYICGQLEFVTKNQELLAENAEQQKLALINKWQELLNVFEFINGGTGNDVETVTIATPYGYSERLSYPRAKTIIGDDFSWNSFTFERYYAINPTRYNEKREKLEKDCDDAQQIREELHRYFRIVDKAFTESGWREFTQHVNGSPGYGRVYYGQPLVGGIIYRGKDAEETFSVDISSSNNKRNWTINT